MRIATWNINGLRARLDFLLHWLRSREPDVVGLQELKLTDDQFPHDQLAELGYHAVTHGQKSWNGVAVLSREPAEERQVGLSGQEEMGARLLTVEVGGLSFSTVYCPNGKHTDHEDFPRKLEWFDALAEHFASVASDGAAVLCGDFNICPGPLDTWNEEVFEGAIFHTPEERSRLARLTEAGFADLYRELYPAEQKFSWWDYRGGAFHKNQGMRIDFLLGTSEIVQRTESVMIDRDYRKKKDGLTASDHAPVLAELR